MTDHTNTTPWDNDASLKSLEMSLDRLARADMESAPKDLADRIAATTMPRDMRHDMAKGRQRAKRLAWTQADMPAAVAGRIGGGRLPMQLAAAVGLAATAAAAFLAVRSGTPAVTPEPAITAASHPVEDWLTAAELWSDMSGDELSQLTARATSLGDAFDDAWMMTELFSDEEGSL